MIWKKFLNARIAFSHILENKDNRYIYRLSKIKPTLGLEEKFFLLAINETNNIRLWINLEEGLYKARPTTRLLKWINIDSVSTDINPTWFLYAIKNNNNSVTSDESNNDLDDLSQNFTATTIY